MGIGELVFEPGFHRLRNFGRNRRGRLVIEVNHAALADARPATRCHSPRKASISASLVEGPKLMRRKPSATSCRTPIAARTSLFFIFPDEQALPAETAMPARSNCTSIEAFDAPGNEIAPIVGMRGA